MGLFFAWAIGEGIIVARWMKAKAPPTPGVLVLPSVLFVSLAILAEYRPARPVAVAFAYAVDLAILLQVVGKNPAAVTGWPPPKIPATQIWPGGISAPATSAAGKQSTASKATSAGSSAAKIINEIEQLPGFGLIK